MKYNVEKLGTEKKEDCFKVYLSLVYVFHTHPQQIYGMQCIIKSKYSKHLFKNLIKNCKGRLG